MKNIMIILAGPVAIFLIIFLIWVFMSPGTIREYDGEKSLSEKFVMDINGAPNGFFINSKNTDNPVLLFVSVVAFFDCICVSGNTVMRIEMETSETGNIIKEWE